MPNIKSAKKRVKTNKRDEIRNRAAKSTLKKAIKATNEAISGTDAAAKKEQVRTVQSLIARTHKRGIIHKKKASRLQSRIMRKANRPAKAAE